MNKNKIIEAFGLLDEKFVEEANPENAKKCTVCEKGLFCASPLWRRAFALCWRFRHGLQVTFFIFPCQHMKMQYTAQNI